MTKCPNCNVMLLSRFDFCPKCGEELNRHKFTFKHITKEFIEGFTHLDFKIIHYVKYLISQPWTIIYEYLHGRKKKYFNPYVAFVLFAGLLHLILHNQFDQQYDLLYKKIVLHKSKLPPEIYIKYLNDWVESKKKGTGLVAINKYFHVINLFIYAFPFWVFIYLFFKKSYNYIEVVFSFMILWTLVLLYYSISTFFSTLFYSEKSISPNLEVINTCIISIFIGYSFYKLLDLGKNWLWIFVFASLFYIIDSFIIEYLINFTYNNLIPHFINVI